MTDRSDPAIEAGGEVLEDEICRLAASLDKPERRGPALSEIGRKAARRVLDSWPLAFASIGTLLVVTALNLTGYGPTQYSGLELSNEDAAKGLVTLARFAAVEASSFAEREGRLPETPQEIGLSEQDDITFERSPTGRVVAVVHAEGVTARSDRAGIQRAEGSGR